jgi:SAM-dependent methyltransferase
MYKVGGVYLDIKSTVNRSLDEVLREDDSYLLSHWRNHAGEPFHGWGMHDGCGPRGEYQQWHIIAEPNHPFLEAVIKKVAKIIEDYDPFRDDRGKTGVWKTTGPIPYTIAIREIVDQFDHRLVDIEDLGFYYSIADDARFGHTTLLGAHYSSSVEPIVVSHADAKQNTLAHKEVFNRIYHNNAWGTGSGPGSSYDNTVEYRRFLQNFMKTNNIKSVVDIGCGDWQFSQHIDWGGVRYVGLDVSDVVLANTRTFASGGIEFHELDALAGELPTADLAIMKDVLQHWSNADILSFLPKLKNFDRVLITNGFPEHAMRNLNADIRPGEYRSVDLSLPPFNLKGSFVFWYDADEPKFVYCWNRD